MAPPDKFKKPKRVPNPAPQILDAAVNKGVPGDTVDDRVASWAWDELPSDLLGPTPGGVGLVLASSALTVAQSDSGTVRVDITRAGGYTGAVAISVTGLPAGVTAAPLVIASGLTSGVLSLTAAAGATMGATTPVVHATTADSASATQSLALTVVAAGTFDGITSRYATGAGEEYDPGDPPATHVWNVTVGGDGSNNFLTLFNNLYSRSAGDHVLIVLPAHSTPVRTFIYKDTPFPCRVTICSQAYADALAANFAGAYAKFADPVNYRVNASDEAQMGHIVMGASPADPNIKGYVYCPWNVHNLHHRWVHVDVDVRAEYNVFAMGDFTGTTGPDYTRCDAWSWHQCRFTVADPMRRDQADSGKGCRRMIYYNGVRASVRGCDFDGVGRWDATDYGSCIGGAMAAGPLTVLNNNLCGGGIAVLYGGDGSWWSTARHFTFKRNWIHRKPEWFVKDGSGNYVGPNVKSLWESKNAADVTFEGNIVEWNIEYIGAAGGFRGDGVCIKGTHEGTGGVRSTPRNYRVRWNVVRTPLPLKISSAETTGNGAEIDGLSDVDIADNHFHHQWLPMELNHATYVAFIPHSWVAQASATIHYLYTGEGAPSAPAYKTPPKRWFLRSNGFSRDKDPAVPDPAYDYYQKPLATWLGTVEGGAYGTHGVNYDPTAGDFDGMDLIDCFFPDSHYGIRNDNGWMYGAEFLRYTGVRPVRCVIGPVNDATGSAAVQSGQWTSRGYPATAMPLTATVALTDADLLAVLTTDPANPDSHPYAANPATITTNGGRLPDYATIRAKTEHCRTGRWGAYAV